MESNDYCNADMIPEGLKYIYKNTNVRNSQEAFLVAAHFFTMEVGFNFQSSENESKRELRNIIDKDKGLICLNYTHPTCENLAFLTRYTWINSHVMIFAFAGNVLANSFPLDMELFIDENANFRLIESAYRDIVQLGIVIKNEYILKMLAEAQYSLNIPQSFGISRMPYHILENIFEPLSLQELTICMRVNKMFRNVLDQNSFWRKKYVQVFGNPRIAYNDDWKEAYRRKTFKRRERDMWNQSLRARKREAMKKKFALRRSRRHTSAVTPPTNGYSSVSGLDWSQIDKLKEDLRVWFNYTLPKNKHEATIIAIHVLAEELGFSFEEVENLRIILNKNSKHSVLNYRNNRISIESRFSLKYVYEENFAMVDAFVGDTLVNSSSINVDTLISHTANFGSFDTVYQEMKLPEFSKFVKDEFLLKMIAECQYQENKPRTYDVTLLPVHCLEAIMLNLDLKDLSLCSRVSKSFKEVVDSQSLWRKMYERDFKILTTEISDWKQSFKEKKMEVQRIRSGPIRRINIAEELRMFENRFKP